MVRLRNVLLQAMVLISLTATMCPETATAQPEPLPSLQQILSRMRQHDADQSKRLKHYQTVRHYQVQYRGFGTSIAASMDVQVNYDQASGKSFRILSHKGSSLLFDKVLKRAVQSEKEASQDRRRTALDTTNYRFRLIGMDRVDGRPAYRLHVDPVRAGKFLYRGSVWVDAADYAVDKIEVEPAKNPSFWISSSNIENTYADLQGIWLPQANRSESKIRIGGSAVLSIDYGRYQISATGQTRAAGGPEGGAPAKTSF